MKSKKSFFGLFLAALVLLPGCMHVPTYKRQALQSVSSHCAYRGVDKNLIVQAKLLSQADKCALFGTHVTLIHDNDLQVIYFSIHNLSAMNYVLSPVDVDVVMMPYQDIAQLMKTSTVRRLAKGTASSAISGGALYGSFVFAMLFQSIILANGAVAIGAVSGGLALAFFGASIKSIVMNSRITKDIKEKVMAGKVIINSGQQYDGLIFVKSSDYTPTFAVTMHEKNDVNKTITFDVDLRQNQ